MDEKINSEFKIASEKIANSNFSTSNDNKLELYGLYKQGSFGDINTSKPYIFQVEASAKWNSWNNKKGLSMSEAKKQYVKLANKILQ